MDVCFLFIIIHLYYLTVTCDVTPTWPYSREFSFTLPSPWVDLFFGLWFNWLNRKIYSSIGKSKKADMHFNGGIFKKIKFFCRFHVVSFRIVETLGYEKIKKVIVLALLLFYENSKRNSICYVVPQQFNLIY